MQVHMKYLFHGIVTLSMYMYLPSRTLCKVFRTHGYYSSPPLIGTPLQPNIDVLIREVSFGERECYVHW